MIVAERKKLQEISEMIKNDDKILILGCGTCVTVCFSGGEKETGILASALRMLRNKEGKNLVTIEKTIERQCEKEMIEELQEDAKKVDTILSLACGAGVQTIAEFFPDKNVIPALNTKFIGIPEEQGVWIENCSSCGDCILDKTAGICVISRCSKKLLNGPCQGTTPEGKCEVDNEIDCAWVLIYNKLEKLGKLGDLEKIIEPMDWSQGCYGKPGKIERNDIKLPKEEE